MATILTDRDWFSRGVRRMAGANKQQLWNFEVEIFLPGSEYRVPDAVEEVLSQWCRENARNYWVRGSNRLYWFTEEEDAILFNLRFSR